MSTSVQIHLKEFFPSDTPEMLAQKLNFDFNQLLSLGVGKIGLTGGQGELGPVGPIGQLGIQGPRGTFWFTGSLTTPPTATSLGAIIGDFYLNTQEAWQLQGDGVTWLPVLNFGSIIGSYLSTSTLTFTRQINGKAGTDRYITFVNADNSFNDRTPTLSSFTNDILFLHNYNLGAFTFSATDLFTAMQSIYVDQTLTDVDSAVRHHLQLGAVHKVSGIDTITPENESYKIKFYIDGSGVYVAKHAMSPIDTALSGEYTYDSAFKFILSKASTSTPLILQYGSEDAMTGLGMGGMTPVNGLAMIDQTQGFSLGIDSNGVLFLQATSGITKYKTQLNGSTYTVIDPTLGSGKMNVGRGNVSGANIENPKLGLNVLGSFGQSVRLLEPANPIAPSPGYTQTYTVSDDDVSLIFRPLCDVVQFPNTNPYMPPSSVTNAPFIYEILLPSPNSDQIGRVVEIKNLNYNQTWRLRVNFTRVGNQYIYLDPSFTRAFTAGPVKAQGQVPSSTELYGEQYTSHSFTYYEVRAGESITFRAANGFWIQTSQTVANEPWRAVLENSHTYGTSTNGEDEIMSNGEWVPKFYNAVFTSNIVDSLNIKRLSIRKTYDNQVEILGSFTSIAHVVASVNIFTLPSGYRPNKSLIFSGVSSDGTLVATPFMITVANNGQFVVAKELLLGYSYHVNIRFPAEA